jgi:EAL domain-containing protein (putative c-di-GMP-specific phosphodiesterase class I)
MALEMLSRLTDKDNQTPIAPSLFFTQAPSDEQFRALVWQLELLVLMGPWLAGRKIPVSLNISRSLALRLFIEPAALDILTHIARWVRLEISERFLHPDILPEHDPLLHALQPLVPLWLDDFGAGTTSWSCLTSGGFDAIKIDRHLLESLFPLPEGAHFLGSLTALTRLAGKQVIVEGIADEALWQFAQECGISAGQGWLWPEVTLDGLNDLPDCLPIMTGE